MMAPDSPRALVGDLVQLDRDHPGFRDAGYRARRNHIAALALAHQEGESAPIVPYTEEEHAVWRTVWNELSPVWHRHACSQFLDALPRFDAFRTRIPQLVDVNRVVKQHTGFELTPVAGLVSPAKFMRALGKKTFLSTQYIRHASRPLYTPEPDVVHEVLGHAVSLTQPDFATWNALFGRASQSVDEAAQEPLIRAYWYTLEFGLWREGRALKAPGAGLLSSFGELGQVETTPRLEPFDLDVIAQTPFDPTEYQKVLFVADSPSHFNDALHAWVERFVRNAGVVRE